MFIVIWNLQSGISLASSYRKKKLTLPRCILQAKSAGFCYGVKRAVETVKKLHKEQPNRKIYVLGDLVHNSLIREELAKFGIKSITKIPTEPNPGAVCVVRAHGESPENIKKIKDLGYEIVDLTCPDVKKVQQKAISLAQEGYFVVIVGKEEHPEVTAIKANALQHTEDVVVINALNSDMQGNPKPFIGTLSI